MENVVKDSLLTPKSEGMLPKTTVANFEISRGYKLDTMCGNINGKCLNLLQKFAKTECTMSGNGYRNMIYVLCVETQHFTKL